MSDEDRHRDAQVTSTRMDALLAEPAWRRVQADLVAEHVSKTDELVARAAELSEAEIRERLGELKGLARLATAPQRIRLRSDHLAHTLEARARQRDARRALTRGDDLDATIAAHEASLAAMAPDQEG